MYLVILQIENQTCNLVSDCQITVAILATDVRPGCKTQRIAPTLRQVADLVCARTKEREYFKTCIVGCVNCCLQCGPTLTVLFHQSMINLERLMGNNTVRDRAVAGLQKEGKMLGRELW
ncbi:hypothetical protein PoB_004543300 [Plakobranchus ocellatus]|uniref:Uncharacterized protein n=1 Tax=Plakobranchus ocellatus TaxID=259542 RepID=A0AAV4BJF7_9GAST|nr:hypothetical protein PoB_004543300 [Plakobranchus ocellatus]